MSRPPDTPDPPAPAQLWLADLIFPDWLRETVHRAVVLAGAAPSPEVEAFLVALYQRAEAEATDPRVLSFLDRLRAIRACLPPEIPPADVMAILVTLDPMVLRIVRSKLDRARAQIWRRRRAIQAVQRQVERQNVSARATTVFREEATAALTELTRDRELYQQTLRLISRLASPKREPWLTAEAQQLVDRFTRADLSVWRAYDFAAAVLRRWHGLAEDALTAAHIRGRLQPRAKPRPFTLD